MGPGQRAALFGYMPQRPMIVDGTFEENLRFGLDDTKGGSRCAALRPGRRCSWIDDTMVGEFARDQALNLPPMNAERATQLAGDLKTLRSDLRQGRRNSRDGGQRARILDRSLGVASHRIGESDGKCVRHRAPSSMTATRGHPRPGSCSKAEYHGAGRHDSALCDQCGRADPSAS